jgi:hypothetical protein
VSVVHRNCPVRLVYFFLQIHRFSRGILREPNVPSTNYKGPRVYETNAF